MVTNLLSIYAPVHVPAGSFKPANPNMTVILLQLLTTMVLLPLTQAVTLIPLGAEMLMGILGWTSSVPIYLLLSLAECAVVVVIYHFMLNLQDSLFQASEQWILERVTNRGS
jgi:ABC-2 type transport system permease protein